MSDEIARAVGGVREIKVYVSQNMHDKVMQEIDLCACSITGFVRTAIARELIERAKQRKAAARDLPLPGQKSIDGISE